MDWSASEDRQVIDVQRPSAGAEGQRVARPRSSPTDRNRFTQRADRGGRQGITQEAQQDEVCQRLMSVPGIGAITAIRFAAALDGVDRFPDAIWCQYSIVADHAASR